MQLPTSNQINLCPIEAPFGKIVGNVQSFVIKIIINCNFPYAVIHLFYCLIIITDDRKDDN